MNRNDIDLLTPKQIQAEIVRLKEFLPDDIACNHPGCKQHYSHPCEGCNRRMAQSPNWISDLTLAWELLEEMRQAYIAITIESVDNYWNVWGIPHAAYRNIPMIMSMDSITSGAICRAYVVYKTGKLLLNDP